MRRMLLALGVFTAVTCLSAMGRDASARDIFKVRPDPAVDRYDWKRDEFIVRESVLTPRRTSKPSYGLTRNRLHRFQFLGPPEQSGIYGSLQDYYRERNLDPLKYE